MFADRLQRTQQLESLCSRNLVHIKVSSASRTYAAASSSSAAAAAAAARRLRWRHCVGRSHAVQRAHTRREVAQTSEATRTADVAAWLPAPPPDYDFRSASAAATRRAVERWPELADIAASGALAVHERPPGYVERRSDGYREPELVVLVGTAHVSATSAEDARRVIEAVRPDAVVVELCRSRTALLLDPSASHEPSSSSSSSSSIDEGTAAHNRCNEEQQHQQQQQRQSDRSLGSAGSGAPSNPLGLSGGESFWEAFGRSLAQGGVASVVLRVLLATQARRAADTLGVRAGGEFAAAAAAADRTGATLVLGDRPLEITLSRAWRALTWTRRAALLRDLAAAAAAPLPEQATSAAAVEALKSDGATAAMLAALARRYPELVAPLARERDLYLAWGLKRSKAVDGARRVVGVVGRGHLPGVLYALSHDSGRLRFSDLVDGANRKRERRAALAKRLVVELAVGGAAYAAWVALTG